MTGPLLIVAGLDSSGGAGLLRDVATARDMGVETRVAVTAVTAQDDRGLSALHPLPPEVVAAQIAAAGPVSAIKIGMVAKAPIVAAVADMLPSGVPLVLDPVLRTSSGHELLDATGLEELIRVMLPRATLLTPNLPELAVLGARLGCHAVEEDEIVSTLQRAGARDVLIKGGHSTAREWSEDLLYRSDGTLTRFSGPRFSVSLRGTGCQLGTGIAAGLAKGLGLYDAITAARDLVERRFRDAVRAVSS